MTSTALTVQHQQNSLLVTNQMNMMDMGRIFAASGFFKDVKDAAQATVKIMAGAELGIPPVQAMNGIYIVQNKISVGYSTVAALIQRSGKFDYQVDSIDDKGCGITFFKKSAMTGRWEKCGPQEIFTMDMAVRAGLTRNPVWKSYPETMLFSKALLFGARKYCAEIFGGPIYTPDELYTEGVVFDPNDPSVILHVDEKPTYIKPDWDMTPPTGREFTEELERLGYTNRLRLKLVLAKLGHSSFVPSKAQKIMEDLLNSGIPNDAVLADIMGAITEADLVMMRSITNMNIELLTTAEINALLNGIKDMQKGIEEGEAEKVASTP